MAALSGAQSSLDFIHDILTPPPSTDAIGGGTEMNNGLIRSVVGGGLLISTPTPVPGPVVGAGLGLILAGSGLLGWWRRKRKAVATS